MGEISTRVDYTTDGKKFIWHIPFEYASEEQVAVNLVNRQGIEKRLAHGADYVLDYHAVVCVRPAGERLIIWRDCPENEAAVNPARLASYAGQSPVQSSGQSSGQSGLSTGMAYAPASSTAPEKSVQEMWAEFRDMAIAEINSQARAILEDCQKRLTASFDDYQTQLNDTGAYQQGELSRQNSAYTRQIADYVLQARDSADHAQNMIAGAQKAEDDARALNARSGNDALNAQGWAAEAEKSAMDSWQAACAANLSAAQASVHARRPGISAVKCLSEIPGCSPGLFIVNPYLTHAPTPFMGVWPAKSTDDMAWDGVFFIGACLYPDDPALPPELPPPPQPDTPGTGDTWLPCGHHELATASQCKACAMRASCGQRMG